MLLLTVGCAETFRMTYSVYIPPSPIRLENRLKLLGANEDKAQHHYAVLIAGNSEDRHRNNLSLAYQVLIEQGYNRRDIFIFDSEGGNPAVFPITDSTNEKSILIMFGWLKTHVTENDSLLIYMTGHGNKVGNIRKSAFALNKVENLTKEMFIEILSTINPRIGIVFTDFCYWGTIEDEERLSEYIFISATDDDHVSYGTTFGRAFWNSFRTYDKTITLLESYMNAYVTDPMTFKKNANRPNITWSKNRPEFFNILGENM